MAATRKKRRVVVRGEGLPWKIVREEIVALNPVCTSCRKPFKALERVRVLGAWKPFPHIVLHLACCDELVEQLREQV